MGLQWGTVRFTVEAYYSQKNTSRQSNLQTSSVINKLWENASSCHYCAKVSVSANSVMSLMGLWKKLCSQRIAAVRTSFTVSRAYTAESTNHLNSVIGLEKGISLSTCRYGLMKLFLTWLTNRLNNCSYFVVLVCSLIFKGGRYQISIKSHYV